MRRRMDKNILLLTSILAFVLIAGTLVLFFPPPEQPTVQRTIEGCVNLDRTTYALPSVVFAQLPPAPACFTSLVNHYHARRFTDDAFFTSEFYLQPEFYPSFLDASISYWQDPLTTHYGVVGYGTFIPTREVVLSPGETKSIRFFLHTGAGVRTHQGGALRVDTTIPGIHVSLDEASQHGFLLGPNFPVFDPAWVKPVEVTVKALPDFTIQDAVVEVRMVTPTADVRETWTQQWGARYFDATSFMGENTVAHIRVKVQPRE